MTVVRIVLAPSVAKPVVAAVDELVRRIAETPIDDVDDGEATLSADRVGRPSVSEPPPNVASVCERTTVSLPVTLRELRQRWQPDAGDDWVFPSLAQQRADAFVALFLGCDVSLTTEVVVHVRGDGITFDDGTPTTTNASSRRRHPTTRQKRVVVETYRHECVDCQSTDLLELDHNPNFEDTGRTAISG